MSLFEMVKEPIFVSGLKKYYRVHQKEPGLIGSLKSLFKRRYEVVKAVDEINFKIAQGELIGFIGPNGAGKTTTLKCLSGLLFPDNGEVSVLGFNPWDRKSDFLKQIAFVMGQKNQLWWDLPPMETFLLNKEIYEIEDDKFNKNLDELVDLLEVKEILNTQTRKLSLGQRMKCELIASLLHQPKVLFLDEPTIGLDVVMQKKIREFIKVYNKRHQATIILTSHYMGDVQELADRVIIIDKGKIVFNGRLEEITKKYADYKLISLTFSKSVSKQDLEEIGELKEFTFPKAQIRVKREVASLVASELLKKFPIEDLNIEPASIEDIIRQLFTQKDYS